MCSMCVSVFCTYIFKTDTHCLRLHPCLCCAPPSSHSSSAAASPASFPNGWARKCLQPLSLSCCHNIFLWGLLFESASILPHILRTAFIQALRSSLLRALIMQNVIAVVIVVCTSSIPMSCALRQCQCRVHFVDANVLYTGFAILCQGLSFDMHAGSGIP